MDRNGGLQEVLVATDLIDTARMDELLYDVSTRVTSLHEIEARDVFSHADFVSLYAEKDLISLCACGQLLNAWYARLESEERRETNAVICEFASETAIYQLLQGHIDLVLGFVKMPLELIPGEFLLILDVAGKQSVYRSKDGALPERHIRAAAAANGKTGQDMRAGAGVGEQTLGVAHGKCANCEKSMDGENAYVCGGCRLVTYCDAKCQKRHWKHGHKKVCMSPFRNRRELPPAMSRALDEMFRQSREMAQ